MDNRWIKYILITLIILILAACGGSGIPTSAQSSGEEGEAQEEISAEDAPGVQEIDPAIIFADRCARCHGVDRSGAKGPALLPESLTQDAAVYQAIIMEGSGVMPAFSNRVSSEEISALVEFILSDPQ